MRYTCRKETDRKQLIHTNQLYVALWDLYIYSLELKMFDEFTVFCFLSFKSVHLCYFFYAAPDGKEVEVHLIGGGEAEAEHRPGTPPSPCCVPGCICVCHLQRPGMKLIWVPVDLEDDAGEDETDEEDQIGEDGEEADELVRGGEGESEAGDEVDSVVIKQEKSKFHQSLDVLISEGHRRRSDPGPHSVLASLNIIRSQSPPIPPKRTQSPPVFQKPNEDEEENIYESVLPMFDHTPKKTVPLCKELDIPLIKVRKPARRSKLTFTSESQTNNEPASSPDNVPPAIPPRMPITQDSQSHNPAHRGGIALPQPTMEEWRTLLPSSHNSSTATVSSGSPRVPHRAPPPPPKTDPRRLSSVSMQSLTPKKGLC